LQLERDLVTLAASAPAGALPVTVRWQYLVQWTAATQET
jgi:hypothetical protein